MVNDENDFHERLDFVYNEIFKLKNDDFNRDLEFEEVKNKLMYCESQISFLENQNLTLERLFLASVTESDIAEMARSNLDHQNDHVDMYVFNVEDILHDLNSLSSVINLDPYLTVANIAQGLLKYELTPSKYAEYIKRIMKHPFINLQCFRNMSGTENFYSNYPEVCEALYSEFTYYTIVCGLCNSGDGLNYAKFLIHTLKPTFQYEFVRYLFNNFDNARLMTVIDTIYNLNGYENMKGYVGDRYFKKLAYDVRNESIDVDNTFNKKMRKRSKKIDNYLKLHNKHTS